MTATLFGQLKTNKPNSLCPPKSKLITNYLLDNNIEHTLDVYLGSIMIPIGYSYNSQTESEWFCFLGICGTDDEEHNKNNFAYAVPMYYIPESTLTIVVYDSGIHVKNLAEITSKLKVLESYTKDTQKNLKKNPLFIKKTKSN